MTNLEEFKTHHNLHKFGQFYTILDHWWCIALWSREFYRPGKWLRMNLDWDQWILIRQICECHRFQTIKLQILWWRCLFIYQPKSSLKAYRGYIIHEELSKFFGAECFEGTLEGKDSPLAALHGIQKGFIIIQNQCVHIIGEFSRLLIETACQRSATL